MKELGKLKINKFKPLHVEDLKDKHILIIGGPECPWIIDRDADEWDAEEVEFIKAFVSKGGSLLVLGYALMNPEHINIVTSNFGIYFQPGSVGKVSVFNMKKHPLTEGLKKIKLGDYTWNGGKYIRVTGRAIAIAHHKTRPILAACEYNSGRVVAISSVSVFTNRYFKYNTHLFSNMLAYLRGKNN